MAHNLPHNNPPPQRDNQMGKIKANGSPNQYSQSVCLEQAPQQQATLKGTIEKETLAYTGTFNKVIDY